MESSPGKNFTLGFKQHSEARNHCMTYVDISRDGCVSQPYYQDIAEVFAAMNVYDEIQRAELDHDAGFCRDLQAQQCV